MVVAAVRALAVVQGTQAMARMAISIVWAMHEAPLVDLLVAMAVMAHR